MPPLAQIQTDQIDLLQLIDQSPSLSEEQKAYWKKKAGTLTPEQQKQLAQIFLDEKRKIEDIEKRRIEEIQSATDVFIQQVQMFEHTAEQRILKEAEQKVKTDDDTEAENILKSI
jgi:hypothetical protein